jgi:DNA repair photolyase
MKPTIALPTTLEPLGNDLYHSGSHRRLPKVVWVERESAALHPSSLGEGSEVLGVNLARGCAHRCGFCSARAYADGPDDGALYVYRNSVEQLDAELKRRRRPPRAVFLSPATDPFPPINDLQTLTLDVVQMLAKHDVEAWLMTRGYIRPAVQEALAAQREHVRLTVCMTTVHRPLQRILEPLTAPPALRLQQIDCLQKAAVRVQVAVDPLIPGLTDTRENLAPLLESLAGIGVRHVSTGYMFLRPGIRANLAGVLEPLGWEKTVFDSFTGGPILSGRGLAPAQYLPKPRRQRGYAALMALASEFGITVSVSAATNPDFSPSHRHTQAPPRQRRLLAPRFEASGTQLRFA